MRALPMNFGERVCAVILGVIIAFFVMNFGKLPFINNYGLELIATDSKMAPAFALAVAAISLAPLFLAVWFYPAHVAKRKGMSERAARRKCIGYIVGSFTLTIGITLIVRISAL